MATYKYPNDGKIHTRYSELKNCGGIRGAIVVAQNIMLKRPEKPSEGVMAFGAVRHEMLKRESKETGKTAAAFLEPPCSYQIDVDYIEQAFSCEPIPGIVLHGTPDAVGLKAMTIVDYKTIGGSPLHYLNDKQILVYAFNLAMNNIVIRNGVYLIEIWDKERTRIEGYIKVERPISIMDIRQVFNNWIKPRCLTLQAAVNELKKQQG